MMEILVFILIKNLFDKLSIIYRHRTVNASALLLLLGFAIQPGNARADVVTDWNGIANTVVVTNADRAPGAAMVDMAYVHAVIYDAVNAIDGRYSAFAVKPINVNTGASKSAAAATAAFHILKTLFPSQQAFLEARYAESMTSIPEGNAKTSGTAVGLEVATKFMLLRANDGRDANIPYTLERGVGVWQPTPPTFTPALTPWLAQLRPFMLNSPSQFRAPGPPALDSVQWVQDYKETKLYGALNSSTRTQEQTEIAQFYAENAAAQYNRILRRFAVEQNLSVADNARLFAMVYLSIADSMIAGWDSKYHYSFWRPVTAIRAGDTDGNELTEIDPNWNPLAPTPAHPEYPAAHGCLTAAFAESLRAFFGTKKVKIKLSSAVTNTLRSFENTDDLIKEIIKARIYGGMHFRTSVKDGVNIGKNVARWMIKHYFQPAR
jgi:hypothetical protein